MNDDDMIYAPVNLLHNLLCLFLFSTATFILLISQASDTPAEFRKTLSF